MARRTRFGYCLAAVAALIASVLTSSCGSLFGKLEDPPPAIGKRIGADYLWYGINQHSKVGNLPTLSAYAGDLGLGAVRFDVYWRFLEPERGAYSWEMTDAAVSALPPDALILFTVYCTAPWAVKERRDGDGLLLTSVLPSAAPRDYADYRDFIRALARRYAGRVSLYQVENEVYGAPGFWQGSPDEYLELLRTAYAAVKDVDPAAKVLPAGIALGAADVAAPVADAHRAAFDFIDRVYSAGSDSFDLADIHLYYTLDSVPQRLAWLRALMASNGYSKPILASEIGGLDSRARADHSNGYEQSLDLVKRYVLAFAGSAETVFWLSVHRAKDSESLPWADMSLTEDPSARIKKPAYRALRLLSGKIGNFSLVEPVPGGYKFLVEGRAVLVLWSEVPSVVDASAHFEASSLRVTSLPPLLGDQAPRTRSSPADRVSIGREPVFVEQ